LTALGAELIATSPLLRWSGLVVLSALMAAIWTRIGLPAALLIGPMIAGIVLGVNGVQLRVPPTLYLGAQGIVGVMVAAAINPAIVSAFLHGLVLFCPVMAATLLGAALLGWLISRLGWIPGSTAVYGMAPGAATAMVLLGEAEGADVRLVAFMQYVRVLLVAMAASLIARFWAGTAGTHAPGAPWLAPVHVGILLRLLLLAAVGQQLARWLRVPAWALLGPMVLVAALHLLVGLPIELPRWLLAAAYALLGWHIGLSFRRDALLHAGRSLPVVIAATLCLMALCGALAWCLTRLAHVDALTAYLATSPGGLDSVAIIAASTPRIDVPFVLALQSVRLLFVIVLAPWITGFVIRHSPHLSR
jgi:membrane AbrB-like protein